MAMEPMELKSLVNKCKTIYSAMGNKERLLQPEELQQRQKMRRSIVVTRDLKAGEIIKKEDLNAKRPGLGIEPCRMDELVGRVLKNDVESDTILLESDLI